MRVERESPRSAVSNGQFSAGATNALFAAAVLKLSPSVPLKPRQMANSLSVTFYPPHEESPRLERFVARLKRTFENLGVEIIPFEDALLPPRKERLRPGIVVIEQGEGKTEDLAIHRVSSVNKNPLVALFDRPAPVHGKASLQEKLDSIVEVLAWNLIHVPIFVQDDTWTVCTMNGGVVECRNDDNITDDVLYALVPKLTAQVVPPTQADVTFRKDALNVEAEGLMPFVDDLIDSTRIWRDNGLMLSHTSVDNLTYRDSFSRRIVSYFLDNRTGMSYGFLARQLPLQVRPAIPRHAAPPAFRQSDWRESPVQRIDGETYGLVAIGGEEWIVPIPDVSILGTRSGCDKTAIDPSRDIVRLGLHDGELVFDIPVGIETSDCRPSYDTHTIIAHAVGNAIVASILKARGQEDVFTKSLSNFGLSLSHWHGFIQENEAPEGYYRHGASNPSVSCSTPQSAIYSLVGKLMALERCLAEGGDYRGDIHVEPHHGTNISGCMSLTETAEWVDMLYTESLVDVSDT